MLNNTLICFTQGLTDSATIVHVFFLKEIREAYITLNFLFFNSLENM